MQEAANCLKLCNDLLNPNGQVIFRVPNGQSPFALLMQHGDITHKAVFSNPMIERLAMEAGLHVVAIRNPAIVLNRNPLKCLIRLLQIGTGKVLEALVGLTFYSTLLPMQVNIVAHLRRK